MGTYRDFFIAAFRLSKFNHLKAHTASSNAKTLDPSFRWDDGRRSIGFKVVIPAEGAAGVSDRMRYARETVMAYPPLRALQGGIQWRYLTDWEHPSPHLCET
jgi:hypothetical protein